MSDDRKAWLTKEGRHYEPRTLAIVFAASSIGLLISVVWMIIADYSRDWKEYQREFNRLEVARVLDEIETRQEQVDQNRLTELQQQLQVGQAEAAAQAQRIGEIDAELDGMSAEIYLADQNARFTKALLDVAKYEYEEARRHDPDHAEAELAEMQRLESDLAEYRDVNKKVLEKVAGLEGARDQLTSGIDAAEKELGEIGQEIAQLRRTLANLDKPVVNAVLNAPMVDFVNPSINLNDYQTVLDGIETNINFMSIPRVDRCKACHLGIEESDHAEATQPFTTHPNLDVIGASDSPHPFETVGCTICHMGRDRGTSFHGAAHMPDNAEDQERWEHDHHWHRMHHWDNPMLPKKYAEAGCLQCHMGDVFIPGAERLSRGKLLFERLGCLGCHKVAGWEDLRAVGPPLRTIATKTDKDWVKHWIADPRVFRPTTRMPKIWFLANSSGPEDVVRNNVEIDGVVEYLFDRSETGRYRAPRRRGDAARGKTLIETSGCHGCHSAIGPAEEHTEADPRPHAPNLMRVGSKTYEGWLYQWVRNPRNYWHDTVMPDLRLTEQEAADVAAYLAGLDDSSWKSEYRGVFDVPPAEMSRVRDEMIVTQLMRKKTREQSEAEMAAMSERDKRLMVGEQAIARYGCFGCHDIPGFENAQRIGTELTKEGSKYVKQLDFGFVDIPHERQDWFLQKLRHPRSFDEGKVKAPGEKLKMPQFNLTDEESEALVTVLMGLRVEEVDSRRRKIYDARNQVIQDGWRLVRDYNCIGCHLVEGEGGDIRAWIQQIKAREGVSANEALAFAPPNLYTQGAKVQSDWLFRFLKNVAPIRPWLEVRMPTFHFEDEQVNTVTDFFAALEDVPYPFEDYRTGFALDRARHGDAEKLASKDYLNCLSCHVVGDKTPKTPPDSWAPDLSMARTRLRADWIRRWLRNPQDVMPGTRMPSFFLDENSGAPDVLNGDEQAQIDLLADWVMSLGEAAPYPEPPLRPVPPPVPLEATDSGTGRGPATAAGAH